MSQIQLSTSRVVREPSITISFDKDPGKDFHSKNKHIGGKIRAGRSPRGREVELTFHKVTKSGRNGYKTMTMLCLKRGECGKKECGTRTGHSI